MTAAQTATRATSTAAPGAAAHTVRLAVTGMSCAGCVARVESALRAVPGVTRADVNLALERAEVTLAQPDRAPALAAAVDAAGFHAQLLDSPAGPRITLDVAGMTCAGCVARVESALRAVPGVAGADVNLALEQAEVAVTRPGLEPALTAAVDAAGYRASVRAAPGTGGGAAAPSPGGHDGAWLAFSALLTAPLLAQMAAMVTGAGWHLPALAELALAAPVQFAAGTRFYRGAWQSLRHRSASMDVLVALGTSAAFFYSLAVTVGVTTGHLYYEASAVIITLVLFGKWLEARARRGAGAALRELMALRPETASVERDGVEHTVPAAQVQPDETVVVRPGERIPVDGVIVRGETEVDEALLTGESLPVARGPGDAVAGGALNGSGLLHVRCTAPAARSRLARIVALVEDAQMRKAPVQRLVDRVSAVFVPAVVVVALLTLAAWLLAGAGTERALFAAVAVLVIACPCALGLATPTALVAGTGAAARAGILIRDIQALERAADVDTVVFDKTGTITVGRPRVVRVERPGAGAPGPAQGPRAADAVALAASLQSASEHPLARALVAYAGEQGIALHAVDSLRNHPGAGVSGRVSGHDVAVGTPALMARLGVDTAGSDALLEPIARDAASAALVAVDGEVCAALGFADALRDESAAAVGALAARGLATVMLTGDNAATARRIADAVGIADWHADAGPEDKAARVRALAADGHRVAMVGDGVNDAPALAAADLGIAMGGGTDVAMETAGITLMRADPRLVAAALEVSRATLRTIRQNLFWAFVYNVIGIPVAALGLLDPALAGGAMAMSSVCVVANSLRLRRWRPARAQEAA